MGLCWRELGRLWGSGAGASGLWGSKDSPGQCRAARPEPLGQQQPRALPEALLPGLGPAGRGRTRPGPAFLPRPSPGPASPCVRTQRRHRLRWGSGSCRALQSCPRGDTRLAWHRHHRLSRPAPPAVPTPAQGLTVAPAPKEPEPRTPRVQPPICPGPRAALHKAAPPHPARHRTGHTTLPAFSKQRQAFLA